jgi:hypothetical protein
MRGDRLSRPVGLADLLIAMAVLKPETPEAEEAIARTLGYERKPKDEKPNEETA